jgi:hypothetical protein
MFSTVYWRINRSLCHPQFKHLLDCLLMCPCFPGTSVVFGHCPLCRCNPDTAVVSSRTSTFSGFRLQQCSFLVPYQYVPFTVQGCHSVLFALGCWLTFARTHHCPGSVSSAFDTSSVDAHIILIVLIVFLHV